MNIDIKKISENKQSKENTPLTAEEYLKFERKEEQICEIKREWDREKIFSQIESYNMIQEVTVWKAEYCSLEWVYSEVKKWDTLTGVCKEYYWHPSVAYDLMEMYWVAEDLGVWHILFLPDRIWNHQLKEMYNHQLLENELLQINKEKQEIKNILDQYDNYLETTHKLDYNIASFNPLSSNIKNIWDTRYDLYKNIISDENLNIKEKNPNLYTNLNDYLTWEDVFLDWDEELKVYLLEEKSEFLKDLPEIEEKLDGENGYRNLLAAKNYFQKRINSENSDVLSFLDVPLYNYMEAFEQDYLKSVYLDQEFDVWKVNGILKIYEFVRGDFEYTDIKEYIELIWWTFNGVRWLSWRTLKLWTDLMKSINSEVIYDIWIWEDALIESSMRFAFEWEKYIDNASLSQFIKGTEWTVLMAPALASGIIDGYMDAAATIWMFIAEPEQLIRDMKKVPDLLKHIDIQELYGLYAETFDGKPEELYPAIMYTLAYIYVLMIAMPLAAPNLVSKVGELVGKVIGKGKFRKELKELEGEKLKLKEMKEEYSFMNEWKLEREAIYKELDIGNNKIDELLQAREKIFFEHGKLRKEVIDINNKERKIVDSVTIYESWGTWYTRKSILKRIKELNKQEKKYEINIKVLLSKKDKVEEDLNTLLQKQEKLNGILWEKYKNISDFNDYYSSYVYHKIKIKDSNELLEKGIKLKDQQEKVRGINKSFLKENKILEGKNWEVLKEKIIIAEWKKVFKEQFKHNDNSLDNFNKYLESHNNKVIALENIENKVMWYRIRWRKEKYIQDKYLYLYDEKYFQLSLQNYENYVTIKSSSIKERMRKLDMLSKQFSETIWKSVENSSSRINDTRNILEENKK